MIIMHKVKEKKKNIAKHFKSKVIKPFEKNVLFLWSLAFKQYINLGTYTG